MKLSRYRQCCIVAISVFALPLMAADISSTANVELLPAIQLSELQPVNFGLLNNVNGSCTMSSEGQLNGDAGMNCVGKEQPGKFSLNGQAGATVQLSVSAGQNGGINFQPLISGAVLRTITNGSIDITIAGILSLDNPDLGTHQITYTLTANYP